MIYRLFQCLSSLVFIAAFCFAQKIEEMDNLKPFYDACANGDIETVKRYIDSNPGRCDGFSFHLS
jgi:hypothetical protein